MAQKVVHQIHLMTGDVVSVEGHMDAETEGFMITAANPQDGHSAELFTFPTQAVSYVKSSISEDLVVVPSE